MTQDFFYYLVFSIEILFCVCWTWN